MHYHQLTLEQRYMIYALRQEGCSQKRIADLVKVHKSTISRELRRNVRKRGYRPKMAHRLAMRRRGVPRRKSLLTPGLKKRLGYYIKKDWSPEQIAGRFKQKRLPSISHQSIYSYIHLNKAAGGILYKHLRRKRKYRKWRLPYKAGPIHGRVSIDQRPAIVDDRSRIGDWEVDTIVSSNRKSALLTAVERFSRFTLIGHIPIKNATSTYHCMLRLMRPLKPWVLTITSDNGAEFASHKPISQKLDAGFFFAHPYKSWERGLNENTNGLIRQYVPKGSSFEDLTQAQVSGIMKKLNHRPRKALDFKTPAEVLYQQVALGS